MDFYTSTTSNYFVSLYDGICDETKELKKLTGTMTDDNKWIISSSGRHMFVSFAVGMFFSRPGFLAKIHHGIMKLTI